jgi:sulfur transfer protein SufE
MNLISIWLFDLIEQVRHVNSFIFDLAKEMTLQKTLLSSMEKTVRECQSQLFTLAHVNDEIWKQIWNIFADYKVTLDDFLYSTSLW